MQVCPNCGKEVADEARICAFCSAPLQRAREETQTPGAAPQPVQVFQDPAQDSSVPVQTFGAPTVIVRKTDGKAIASLVCGVLGIFACPIILSIVAIVLARQSAKTIKQSNGALEGEGLATGGLVTGIIGIVLGIVQMIVLIVILSSMPEVFSELP